MAGLHAGSTLTGVNCRGLTKATAKLAVSRCRSRSSRTLPVLDVFGVRLINLTTLSRPTSHTARTKSLG